MTATAPTKASLLESMIAGRAFDLAMSKRNKHWHQSEGEEGVVVGAFSALAESDVAVPHFRGSFMVPLLRGSDPYLLALNIFGRAGSTTGGHWRGDICVEPSDHLLGMFSGSLGPSVAYAAGAAISAKRSGDPSVVLASFGDGTASAGILYETFNLAVMVELPIVFVCQNNQYATSLRSSYSLAGTSISSRARAFGLPAVDVDGNDVTEVLDATSKAVDKARGGGGPSLIHALTYRIGGHYMSDPEVYRSAEEVADWRLRDPIARLANSLIGKGLYSPAEVDEMRQLTEARMIASVERAYEADPPAVDDMRQTAFALPHEASVR